MIKLSRVRTAASVPSDFVSARLVKKHEDLIDRFYLAKEDSGPIAYSSAKWKSAKARLKRDANAKCAYCEVPTAVVAHGDVEHFRPKSLYWWLAYTFDNYVFACQICNQTFKSDQFPVRGGTRLRPPRMPRRRPTASTLAQLAKRLSMDASSTSDAHIVSAWARERPDLIHPYLEDPEPLLRYECDPANKEVWLRATSKRGAPRFVTACNEVLGLNREELRKLRYQHYETMLTFHECYQDDKLQPSTKLLIESEFRRLISDEYPFSGMHRFFARAWNLRI
jgi:hypothetical protein